MTRQRIDLPDNFPDDWDVPDLQGGEAGELAMREGERIIGSQRALISGGFNAAPIPHQVKAGVAIYRLGLLFSKYRHAILQAVRRERDRERWRDEP